ncbi:transposase [Chryseobacterium nematophagum]|uniref:Transposase n=1 Tax=Chryseobacterium nematophagum TaxID=2305228 RepID=A0A3M7TC43_9FLAO|nr:transposase [Chryseobacterium nematophagum]RNA60440.1 transposase [Chryseobacterium nematophagum]RNA60524.1 transposase [Chryseobacterium nematophagum]
MLDKKFNFKQLHMGSLVHQKVKENRVSISFLCEAFKCGKQGIIDMYSGDTIDTELLLIWSKILRYDFFRIYSAHLIMYAPVAKVVKRGEKRKRTIYTPKNIYTYGMIDFILDQLEKGEKTTLQIKQEYGIPRSTLHKWINKYKI